MGAHYDKIPTQLRNIHRMQVIEDYADGEFKSDFGTWLEYKPRGGYISNDSCCSILWRQNVDADLST